MRRVNGVNDLIAVQIEVENDEKPVHRRGAEDAEMAQRY